MALPLNRGTAHEEYDGHKVEAIALIMSVCPLPLLSAGVNHAVHARFGVRYHFPHFENDSRWPAYTMRPLYRTTLAGEKVRSSAGLSLSRCVTAVHLGEATGALRQDILHAVFWQGCVGNVQGRKALFELSRASGTYYGRAWWLTRPCGTCSNTEEFEDTSGDARHGRSQDDAERFIHRRCGVCKAEEAAPVPEAFFDPYALAPRH